MLKGEVMFRTLRLKLTLINILIMGFLLLLFVTGTYFLMEHQIFTQSERLMRNIALAIESESAEKLSQYEKTEYFYVITNAAGDITQTFSNNTRSDLKELPELVHKIFAKGKDRGDFDWHDRSYTFLKVPHKQGPGFLVIFLSIERDMEVLSFLLAALSIAGILCLALAFYSSLFLADKALIPIRKSWQRQRDFVADASHELRTPLAVMQTNLELVMGNPNETVADQEIWLKNVQTEISHMTRLVEDLLLLARIDSEQQLLELSRFSLDQAIYDVIKPIIPMAETKGIKLRLEIEPQVEFNGDEKRIKQLVVILIDNAIKHTPAGGEVALKMANRGSSVEITVSDTGEGIEPEHLEKIFERFYRIDKARSKSGTGLGLSIADWIVKSHHGSIKVKSSPGKGTTFLVMLQNRPPL
ncbi:integral membrane sensor signal transduction histidine kinase [Desulfotomaculum nigrificans CO-1-SRB]|uniref:histidine kinase n=2 Tax=Desulfotomaculum nigrificans TaxID=1565 RepID=F6B6I1_DESCC|nr:integral membrane sensor signal transduction histidine kinase [Desulfotomaculum nigrificans CO-1-SRB]